KVVRRLLRETALRLEPLREIVRRLKNRGSIPVEEYDEIIRENYPSEDHERAFKNILIWGAFLKIFRMNEEDSSLIPIDIDIKDL
ncbi:MAG: AAA-associated domain-containing protein, partial [Sulfolobales archaeon]